MSYTVRKSYPSSTGRQFTTLADAVDACVVSRQLRLDCGVLGDGPWVYGAAPDEASPDGLTDAERAIVSQALDEAGVA